jgi:hypothetical protein
MTTDSDIAAAIHAYGDQPTEDNLTKFLDLLGNADGYMLSDGGTPLAPNPRALKAPDGRTFLAAFTSVERAAEHKPASDGVLRAPFPVICATARVPGVAGVFLNAHDDTASLIEGRSLRAIQKMEGSHHPIVMVDPAYPATLLIHVGANGAIEADGLPRTVDELKTDLAALQAQGGIVQYARDAPNEAPSDGTDAVIRAVLDLIAGMKLPIAFVEQASAQDVKAARSMRGDGKPLWRRLLGR